MKIRINEVAYDYSYYYESNADSKQIIVEKETGRELIEKTKASQALSTNEKLYHANQSFLFLKNPVRVPRLLDCWRYELRKRGIICHTAIKYKDNINKVTTASAIDTLFYTAAMTTEERNIGITNEITIQGFAKIIPGLIIHLAPKSFYLPLALWITVCMLLLFFAFRKKKKPLIEECPSPVVYFDRALGRLSQGDVIVHLTTENLKVFVLLWDNNHEHFADTDFLLKSMYGLLEKDAKDRFRRTIKRLREQIEPLLEIKVMNIARKGYQLKGPIKEYDDTQGILF
jgi:DNA-binding winged helix-turn-helix (wHTH) protein